MEVATTPSQVNSPTPKVKVNLNPPTKQKTQATHVKAAYLQKIMKEYSGMNSNA
jgi:hypothetical protein